MREREFHYTSISIALVILLSFFIFSLFNSNGDESNDVQIKPLSCSADYKTGEKYEINGHPVELTDIDDDEDSIMLIFEKPND